MFVDCDIFFFIFKGFFFFFFSGSFLKIILKENVKGYHSFN